MSPSLIENPLHCMESLLGKHWDSHSSHGNNIVCNTNCVSQLTNFYLASTKKNDIVVKKEYNSSRSRVRNIVINYALHALGNNVERIECSLFLRAVQLMS